MVGFGEKRQVNCGPLKTVIELHHLMSKKISAAVDFASRASIYNPKVTAIEFTTAQSILVSLMHSMLIDDISFCVSLLELATTVDHLRSSYLPTWLKDDFNFDDQQVVQVISRVAFLVRSGLLIIPSHILKVFVGLAPKYRVIECCRASGSTDVLNFLAEFGIVASSNNNQPLASSPSMNNPGAVSRNSNSDGGASSIMSSAVNGGALLFNKAQEFLVENSGPRSLPVQDQEVWVEESNSSSVPSQTSTEGTSSTLSYIITMREYLKVPDYFEEEELLRLITYSDNEGSTPLHNAVKEGDPYIVECMLELGANVDASDTFGYTPTHLAASMGSVVLLQVLSQHRANLSMARQDGCTPLHEAIINGHAFASKWLLDHGADINIRNSDGWTPLHIATQWNQVGIVKLLLENGADLNIYNDNGKTPIDVARDERNTSILDLLSAHLELDQIQIPSVKILEPINFSND